MASFNDLIARTRLELSDQPRSFAFAIPGDGQTYTYDLHETARLKEVTVNVIAGGTTTTLTESTDYVVNYDDGVVTLFSPVSHGFTITFTGARYRYFTDDTMASLVETAIYKHTVRRQGFVFPVYNETTGLRDDSLEIAALEPVEPHLIAILGAIEALWVLLTDTSTDIDIFSPEGMSIPRSQRYRQLSQQIAMLEDKYKSQSAQLNVGMYRIEVIDLRRQSRTTGRLVPVYESQEFDDRRRAHQVRMYPPIDQPATNERPDYLPVENLDDYVSPAEGS